MNVLSVGALRRGNLLIAPTGLFMVTVLSSSVFGVEDETMPQFVENVYYLLCN
ncbi:MAG: hypothetical protein SVY53_07100 [Chloroflexota bacterium]|nr:hypothetical protein [Chloroflexota bacterium]